MEDVTGAPADAIEPVAPAPAVSDISQTPSAAPAAPVVPVEPVKPAVPETRREALERALKNPTRRGQHAAFQPRSEVGKFAPGAPQKPAEAPAPVAPPIQRPALLKSLKKDLEPHWNNAPPELLNAFAQREADFERGATEWKSKTEQASAVLDQFKPYEWILRNEGTTPQAAIGPLLQTAALLRTGSPQQKAQSVAQMMQQFGIPLEHIQSVFGGQSNAQPPAGMDPQYSALHQQVQTLTQTLQQTKQQQEQALLDRSMTAIQQFASDPSNQYFPQVQDRMLALLQTPQLLGQDVHLMSEREKLKVAYDAAVRLDSTLAGQVLAQQQAQIQQQAREKAQAAANTAKAAAVQVTGAPGSPLPASVNPNDRRSVIANALRSATA